MKFLKKDKTDEKEYRESYNCVYFTEALHNNAEKKGIKCAAVIIYCDDDKSHALVMFPLKNGERLYIEPQSDCIASVEEGEPYQVFNADGNCVWGLGTVLEIDHFT